MSGACFWRPVHAQCATACPPPPRIILYTPDNQQELQQQVAYGIAVCLTLSTFSCLPCCCPCPLPLLPPPPSPQRHTDAILQDQELRTILQGLEAHALYGEDGLPRINYDGFSQVGGRCWEAGDVGRLQPLQRYFRRRRGSQFGHCAAQYAAGRPQLHL
jgi:hypothetical protein